MSKKENPQRTERQNAVVEIYRQGNAKTVSELTAQLRANGMKILPRTVRRYLKDVEGVELLERPEKTTEGRRTRQSRVIDVYTADTTQTVPQVTAVLKTQGINITAPTVRRYLENAELVPPKKEVKIFSPSDHARLQQKIREGIANGKRLEEIAAETGVSLSKVNRTLRAMGGRKGEKNPTKFKKLSPKERDVQGLPIWQQTWETVQRVGSKAKAAAELGISIDAINSHLTNLGMNFDERRKPRPRKERLVEPTIPKNPSPPSAAEKRRAFILSLSTHEVTIDYLLDQVNTTLPPDAKKVTIAMIRTDLTILRRAGYEIKIKRKHPKVDPDVVARRQFLLSIPDDAKLTIDQVVAQVNANLPPGAKKTTKLMVLNDLYILRKNGHIINIRRPNRSENKSPFRVYKGEVLIRRAAIRRLAGPDVTIIELLQKLKEVGIRIDRGRLYYDINRLREQGIVVPVKWEKNWIKRK